MIGKPPLLPRKDQSGMETTRGHELFLEALKVLADAVDKCVIVAGPEGALRHVNRRASTLLGWERPEGLATRSLESIPVAAFLRSRLGRDPGPWEEETAVDVRGRMIPVVVAKHPIEFRGHPIGSLVLITDLRDLSNAIAERDRARQNDRAKTRSLHMVAHDMGGPITILNGYVSLVFDGSISIEQLEPQVPMLV